MAGYISVNLSQVTQAPKFSTGYFTATSLANLTTGFVSAGGTVKGKTVVLATVKQENGLYTYEANYTPGYLKTVSGSSTAKMEFVKDADWWNSAYNVGHSISLSSKSGDKWTVRLGQYDDTVQIANKGNNINTGAAEVADWVIINGDGGNTVNFGANAMLSISSKSSKNTVTVGGVLGQTGTGKWATIAGDSNVISAANGYASVSGKKNEITFTSATAERGFVTLAATSAQDTIKIAGTLATVKALGGNEHYVSVSGASGYISVTEGKKDTIDAVQAQVTLGAAVEDAFILGAENTVSINTTKKVTDQGNKDTLILEVDSASLDAAGTNGSIKSKAGNGVKMDKVTISGSGYTFTGSTVAGGDAVTVTGASNKINLGKGDDTASVTGNYNTVSVGDGNDHVTVTGGSNSVKINDGETTTTNDEVKVTGAFNTVQAGYIANDAGSDTIKVAGTSNYVDVSKIADTATMEVQDNGKANTILGGTKGIKVHIQPQAVDQKVVLAMGADSLYIEGALGGEYTMGGGDDTVTVSGGTGHKLDLGTGADSVYIKATYETIYSGTGDDTLIFDGTAAGTNTDGFNYVDLVEDNNLVSVIGGDGWTTINGGVSADSLFFTAGDVEKDVLNLGSGNDYVFFDSQAGQSWGGAIARANNTSVKAGVGDDSIFAWSAEQAMFNGGTGDDSINIVNARYTTIVGGEGDDSIVLGKDNNGNIATDKSTGYNFINLVGDASDPETGGSRGHNIVTIGGNLTNNTILGGSEKDVFDLSESGGRNEVTLNAKNSTVTAALRDDTITAATKGVDVIDASAVQANQEVVINNYSIADKDILAGADEVAFTRTDGTRDLKQSAFVGTTSVFKADGTVVTAQNGSFNAGITPTEGDAGVQVYVQDTLYGANATQAVWFATDYGSNINGSKDHVKVAMVLTGANNDAADTIIGGDLADTMYAGTGDTLAGGLGNDSLVNTTAVNASREEFGIARYTGKDTVQNFDGGFGASDDAVLFYEGTLMNGTSAAYSWSAGAGTLTLNNGSGSLVLQMADGNDSISAHTVLRNGLTGGNERLTAIAQNSTEVVTDATVAKYYYGSKNGGSAIDVSGLTFGVKIDLGNSGRYFEAGENYSYITAVTGSNGGDNFLAGNGSIAETLTGGNGVFNTLYGGGSANDVMYGGGVDALGVEATDIFYFGQSDGKDVINNIGTGDKVMLYDMVDDGSVVATKTTLNGGNYLQIQNKNTGATAFLQDSGSATYQVLFTDGINGAVTTTYEVTGTDIVKK